MRWIVVFDTNVLFSGLGWRGTPYRCLELARAGLVEGLTCREVLEELAEKLETKLGFSSVQVTDTIGDLLTFLRLVTITHRSRWSLLIQTMIRWWSVRSLGAPPILSQATGAICSHWGVMRALLSSVRPIF